MQVYEIQLTSYDYHEPWLFSHESKTAAEFDTDFHEAIRAVGVLAIDSAQHTIDVTNWINAIIPALEQRGYKHIQPRSLVFRDDPLQSRDDNSAWLGVVGQDLYDKAIRHNFEGCLRLFGETHYFITRDKVYHRAECEELLKDWGKELTEINRKFLETGEYDSVDLQPCPKCIDAHHNVAPSRINLRAIIKSK